MGDSFEKLESESNLRTAQRMLRAEREGALRFGEHVRPIRFVIDNATGALVAPVMYAMLEELNATLFVPDEDDDSLQLMVTPEEIDGERHESADRWRAHHGEPTDTRWAMLIIDSGRLGPIVHDGDTLMAPNPLASAEAGLLRRLNSNREALRSLCKEAANVEMESPVAVAIDPDGIHVRGRFGVVRVEFERTVEEPSEAARIIEALAGGGAS